MQLEIDMYCTALGFYSHLQVIVHAINGEDQRQHLVLCIFLLSKISRSFLRFFSLTDAKCISNEFFREAHKGETGKTGIGSIGR